MTAVLEQLSLVTVLLEYNLDNIKLLNTIFLLAKSAGNVLEHISWINFLH